MGQVVAHPGMALANGLQQQMFVVIQVAVKWFGQQQMGIDGAKAEFVGINNPLERTILNACVPWASLLPTAVTRLPLAQ
jgi:hypothetical protein